MNAASRHAVSFADAAAALEHVRTASSTVFAAIFSYSCVRFLVNTQSINFVIQLVLRKNFSQIRSKQAARTSSQFGICTSLVPLALWAKIPQEFLPPGRSLLHLLFFHHPLPPCASRMNAASRHAVSFADAAAAAV
jgi:hypothetical protein